MRVLLKRIKINILPVFKTTSIISGSFFSLLSVILSFLSWNDIGLNEKKQKLFFLCILYAFSFIISLIYTLSKRSRVVWENGSGKIQIIYGDLLKKGFPRRKKDNRIVVIAVNNDFDTIVDETIPNTCFPLISPLSLHGKWIKEMEKNKIEIKTIDEKITASLSSQNVSPTLLGSEHKKRGKLNRYPIGTIATIEAKNNVTFFLLALSQFDRHNKAYCSKKDFVIAIESLISFYDKQGQGFELFIPLLGTNLGRTSFSHSETLSYITHILQLNKKKIHGTVNIVIFNQDKDKISIFDKNI